jgi:hypothetical protein
MTTLPTVAFDEAGNTGQNLLDVTQPVFVTYGVCLSDSEIGELRDLLGWAEEEELHFSRLKRSRAGRDRIVQLFGSPLITDRRAKGFAVHKPYMVTTKVIDMLMEELAHRSGLNMYEDGGAHATANLFWTVGPVFCGEKLYAEMLRRFVDMVRTGRFSAIGAFYGTLRRMYAECSDETFGSAVATLIATESLIGDLLDHTVITDLDPAIPAFISVATEWDKQIQAEWQIVHDESKPLAFELDYIQCFLASDEPRRGVGQGEHYGELPLRATSLAFHPSHEVPQLQVADLISSSAAHVFRGVTHPPFKDELWERLIDSPFRELSAGRMWPSAEVDPDKLGRRGDDGSWVRVSGELVARGMERKYGPDWREKRRARRTT